MCSTEKQKPMLTQTVSINYMSNTAYLSMTLIN